MTTYHWNRTPGVFVNKRTGAVYTPATSQSGYVPPFPGTVREWYETLIETVIDLRNCLHREAFAQIGECNTDSVVLYAGKTVLPILECSILYHPEVANPMGTLGTLAGMHVRERPTTDPLVVVVEVRFKGANAPNVQANLQGNVVVQDIGVKRRPHINNAGQFQSDKYVTCPPGKVPLSVKDITAQDLLWEYAQRRRTVDAEFSEDLEACLLQAGFVPPVHGEK